MSGKNQEYVFMRAFQIAAEESGSLVFIYDLKTQTIRVDPRTARAFGVNEVQPGVPYDMVKAGVVTPDTVEESIRIHEAVLQGAREAGGVVRLVQVDGTESVQELKFRAVLNRDGSPTGSAVGVYRDITARAMEEMEQERYRQAVHSSNRYTFRYDPREDSLAVYAPLTEAQRALSDGQEEYLTINNHFMQSVEQGTACPADQIELLRQAFSEGTEQAIYVQMYHLRTGRPVWYGFLARHAQKPGLLPLVYGLLWDASEEVDQRQTYQKLQRALLGMQNEYLGIFEVDLLRDRYTTLSYRGHENFALEREGGYTEALHRCADALVNEDYREDFLRFGSLENLSASLKRESRIELEYTTQSQENRWLRTIYQVTEWCEGEPVRATMYQADIDKLKAERLLQQRALREAYRYAESANAAKTEFLSRMSHDIRTPMNAIVGMAAIAGTHLNEPDRVRDCLAKINSSSRHLLSLINEILDMSKIESGAVELQVEEFSLADLVDETLAITLPSVQEHRHTLEVDIQKLRHERVFGDSLRLQQAFVNLISNAVKYTPDGGRIRLTMQERPSHSENYAEYEFIFEDNGIGMTEEFQKILFEPFTRAEDSRLSKVTGTGLGMAITHNLIRMMDGEIRVDSQPGRGSRFAVTIHLRFVPEEGALPDKLRGLPVLMADDDKDCCESTCLLLREIGLDAECCLSGQEAVDRVVRRSQQGEEDYFAIILDWKMPGMDGLETAARIREAVGDQVPILFLTAYDWSAIEAQARELGVTHFLTKPLFKSRLLGSFHSLIQPEQPEEPPAGADYTGRRVLLAEDNDLNAEIAQELLSMLGVETRRAANGREAVEAFLASQPGEYDMIFLDIQMPVMNGYEAARAIRSSTRPDAGTIPITAMTANAFAEDIKQSLAAGMDHHLSKPVDLEALRRVMDSCLNP